jgi:energy-coupling factor transporter transmembrane protein EcfT
MVFSLTTNPYHFVESLQKDAKLKRKFAYGILCAFNLLPHIKNEFQNARLALQVRGVAVGPFSLKPLFSTLVNSIKWSETLSIAMQSKGFHED